MGDHAQEMKRPGVVGIGIADDPVEAFRVVEATGAMMSHCRCKRLFGAARRVHGDISNRNDLTSVARPIAPETEVDLAGAAIDPDRLIAGQRARRPVPRITCDVRSGMKNQPAAAIGSRQDGLFLIADHVAVAMMSWRLMWLLMGIGPSRAAAEGENGGERDDGSHQHDPCPLMSQAPSIENAAGVWPASQVCHIRA